MEQRIKIVWALSLISMLLISTGQGYWLWNQYQYKNEEYAGEIREVVLEAVHANDSIRKKMPKKIFGKPNASFYNIDYVIGAPDSSAAKVRHNSYTIVIGSMKGEDTSKSVTSGKDDSLIIQDKRHLIFADTVTIYNDDDRFRFMSLDESIELFQLQTDVPFTLERFDSVLTTRLSNMPFTTKLTTCPDTTYQWTERVERLGNSLVPIVRVVYPYNPLKHELVQVDVRIMPHTLLFRMGWQLIGSFLLILLLAVCLLFQIKTILKQRRLDELRKSFVNTMIHELKRPVQALKMCVAFLNNKTMRTDEQVMDEVVRDSLSELDNLSAYLQKLRDMTRADDEQTQLSLSTFDLKPVVEKLIRLQHTHENKQISFETHLADNLLVTADPVHIANIISNLIENAIKYSGASVHICVECTLLQHQLILKVSDNGMGIPASEQGHVFDKFYRGSNLPDHFIPGIGLGLSYVKLLVDAHRGNISLSSQLGRGTTVEINIPQ